MAPGVPVSPDRRHAVETYQIAGPRIRFTTAVQAPAPHCLTAAPLFHPPCPILLSVWLLL